MSTFSPNLNIEEVARGADVGTWDTPTNSNWTLMDSALGGIAIIPLNNSNVMLSPAQFQSKQITFNSTLTGSVTITFPTSFIKSYEIQHLCTGSSAFTITLATTATGGQVICAIPGETIDCFNDGVNIKYKNLGRIGSFVDLYASSMPNWSDGCTINPYLPCTGVTFSSATFPILAVQLGSTTTPDLRGRTRFALDQGGTTRLSAILASSTIGTAGGDQNYQLHNHVNTLSDPGHTHTLTPGNEFPVGGAGGTGPQLTGSGNSFQIVSVLSAATGITINNANAGAGGSGNLPPLLVAGITMIRAG